MKDRLKRKLNLRMRGFTLIELLVVIAIVGVLGSTIYAPFNEARKKGRDGKRVADIKAIQSGLTLFADDNDSCFPNAKAAPSKNGYFAKSANKYISPTLFDKITIGNPVVIIVDTRGAIVSQISSPWTSKTPYTLRSVGDDSECTKTVRNDSLFPNYQLSVELETHSSALDGDADTDMSAVLGKVNGAANSGYDGYNMSDNTNTEECATDKYKPGSLGEGISRGLRNSLVGSHQCVYDVSNL